MAETIDDLNFIDDDDDIFDNGSFDSGGGVVDNDDWDESSGNVEMNDLEESEPTEENDSLTEEETSEEQPTYESTDVVTELLKSRGIQDSSKIKFENESGEIEEKDWKDLSIEEQMNIIQGEGEEAPTPETGLDDSEIDLINRIRLSNMSVDDYIQYEVQKGISQYAAQQNLEQEPSYVVDDLSDDELYVLDLQTKVDGLTDEELVEALDLAKSNEALYAKQVEGLRKEYKELENNKIASELALQEQTRLEQFAQFSNSVANSINNFNSIGELDVNMEDDDANELYNFITGTDPAGINYFAKALNDPDTLTRVAWFALHGEDVINSISDYYKGVISQVSKSSYEKGKADAKPKTSKKNAPEVVIQPKNNKSRRVTTIYDLD